MRACVWVFEMIDEKEKGDRWGREGWEYRGCVTEKGVWQTEKGKGWDR